jgi:NAD(P)H-hydrate epimerase
MDSPGSRKTSISALSLDREHSRLVDQIAIHEFGMSGLVLMENAGRGCAERLLQLGIEGEVVVCCGAGNNGGDGLVIARHLRNSGVGVRVLLSAMPESMSEDARQNYEILAKTKISLTCLAGASADEIARQLLIGAGQSPTWIVDALLGTGASGLVRPPLDMWIRLINASTAKRLAVDIPSGLDCDSGMPQGECIRADMTCSFVSLKPCFLREPGRSLAGKVSVIDIGIPHEILEAVKKRQSDFQAIDFADEQSENGANR